jgi:hypothetical protein
MLHLYQCPPGPPWSGSQGVSMGIQGHEAATGAYQGTLLTDPGPRPGPRPPGPDQSPAATSANTSWPSLPASLDAKGLRDAYHLDLTLTARSPGAQALVEAVVALIEAEERSKGRRKRRASERPKLYEAVAAVLGGSLLLWAKARPWFRSKTKAGFTGAPVAVRQFAAAVDGMAGTGLLHSIKGIRFTTEHFDTGNPMSEGRAARHWPTEALLDLAMKHGVTAVTVRADFRSVPPTKPPRVTLPVVLQALGPRGGVRGATLNFDPGKDDTAAQILADVRAQNALAGMTDVTGCLPPRWKRCFKVNWTLYGRWHAVGADGNYQRMSEAERLSWITIGGEPVAEVDIGASHLSLLHARLGLPLPPGDLYAAVTEFPRDVVKAWVTGTLGKGSPVVRWTRGKRVSDAVRVYDPRAVGEAVVARYPFLRDPTEAVRHLAHLGPPKRILTHHLMGMEARIITAAMGCLLGADHPDWPEPRVLSLPMHDGLIVPLSAVNRTTDYLWHAGAVQARVPLRLKVSVGGQEPFYPEPPSDLAVYFTAGVRAE